MKNRLEEQIISLQELVERLSGIAFEIRTHTKSIIDQSVNKSDSMTTLPKDDSLMKKAVKHDKNGDIADRFLIFGLVVRWSFGKVTFKLYLKMGFVIH